MALSFVPYTGNGSTVDFTITFPYIAEAHVVVKLDGVVQTVTTDYTFFNASTIRFNTAPASGVRILIERKTSQTSRLVDYTIPGSLSESDLDNDSLQAFYMAQEAIDTADAALTIDQSDGKFDAQSKIIKNVANGAAANDAVNKSQLDAAQIAASNVPTPGNPADDLKLLQANAGVFGWTPVLSAFGATLIDDANASAARTTLGVAGLTDSNTFTKTQIWSKGADIASSATLVLGSDGNYFDVTGTTTITGITVTAGTLFMLQFDAALTLTNNASWSLPTGANITTAAGDHLIGFATATNTVRVLGYFRASGKPVAAENFVQRVYAEDGAVATGTTVIASDDTIPQSTEGDQYMSVSITPKFSDSRLIIAHHGNYRHSAGNIMTVALFKDSDTDALCVAAGANGAVSHETLPLYFEMASGTTSAITFKIRCGSQAAGTTTFNGSGGGRLYGGKFLSTLTVYEVRP